VNYYERHLGDYARDTAHLSMLEHGAYCLLLDRYYATEQGIPAEQAHRLARAKSRDERAAVDAVLAEFFALEAGVWTNSRAIREVAKAQGKIKAAKENGKLGGRPKATKQEPTGFVLGSESGTQQQSGTNPLQTPDTSLKTKDSPASLPPLAEPARLRSSKRCPDDFAPTDEMLRWAAVEAQGADIVRELAKFRDHAFARGHTDWPAAFRNWMRRASDDAAKRPQSFLAEKAAESAKWAVTRPAAQMFDFVEMEIPHASVIAIR